MPAKISPLPPVGGGGAASGTEESACVSAPSTNPVQKPRIVSSSRFTKRITRATRNLSTMASKNLGRESAPGIVLVSAVGLGLLVLGIYLVYIGDEKYIVDVIVLGAFCLAMGIASFFLGMVFVLRPMYGQRKRMEEEEERQNRASTAASQAQVPSVAVAGPSGLHNPNRDRATDSVSEGASAARARADATSANSSAVADPVPSTSSGPPGKQALYDSDSLQASPGRRGDENKKGSGKWTEVEMKPL